MSAFVRNVFFHYFSLSRTPKFDRRVILSLITTCFSFVVFGISFLEYFSKKTDLIHDMYTLFLSSSTFTFLSTPIFFYDALCY